MSQHYNVLNLLNNLCTTTNTPLLITLSCFMNGTKYYSNITCCLHLYVLITGYCPCFLQSGGAQELWLSSSTWRKGIWPRARVKTSTSAPFASQNPTKGERGMCLNWIIFEDKKSEKLVNLKKKLQTPSRASSVCCHPVNLKPTNSFIRNNIKHEHQTSDQIRH